MALLTERLSNGQFQSTLAKLLGVETQTVAVLVGEQLCDCNCGQAVPPGRRFVNQTHYDRSKGLSPTDAEQLIVRYQQGVPQKHLAREHGVALSTVKRLLRKQSFIELE